MVINIITWFNMNIIRRKPYLNFHLYMYINVYNTVMIIYKFVKIKKVIKKIIQNQKVFAIFCAIFHTTLCIDF